MKTGGWLYGTILVAVLTAFYGISQKKTYTDISEGTAYLDEIYVAQIPEDIAVTACEEMRNSLPMVKEIVKVKAMDTVEHLAGTSRQRVRVEKVYEGDCIEKGEELYLTFARWSLSLYGEPASLERGFVNILEEGEEYLAFVGERAETVGEELPVYQLYGESVIAPIFSYTAHTNKINEMGKDSTYVPYKNVSENEFFASSLKALEALEGLKEEMIRKYQTAD